jgi:hypothetical protein
MNERGIEGCCTVNGANSPSDKTVPEKIEKAVPLA